MVVKPQCGSYTFGWKKAPHTHMHTHAHTHAHAHVHTHHKIAMHTINPQVLWLT